MNGTIGSALCRLFSEDALMRDYNGYLSVKQGETLLFEGGFGYADVQNDVRATGDTIYLIGSMTKPITATCILMLENQGLLSLDDTITSYFPDYSAVERVTVRHLLTQTSGLPDYWNRVGISSIDYTDANAIFDFIKTFELVCKPGEAFQYCNSNYLVLGMLIEKITGETYLEYARAHLFDPLEMHRTGVIPEHHACDNVAVGYMRMKPDVKRAALPENTVIMGNMHGAGCIYTCANDLMKFDAALNNNRLLPEPKKLEMWKRHTHGYGYGWFVTDHAVWHGGDCCGFSSRYTKYLRENITVVALNNVDGKRESHMGHYSQRIEACIL